MSNLITIQSQIEKLQKQAAEIKAKDFVNTVKEIQAKMKAFGITLKDLQPVAEKRRKAAGAGKASSAKRLAKKATKAAGTQSGKPSKQAGKKVAPKYRGPNGETWSGRGTAPRWLAQLMAQGKSRESFAIKKG